MVKLTSLTIVALTVWFIFLVYAACLLYHSSQQLQKRPSDEAESHQVAASNGISARLDQAMIALKRMQAQNDELKVLLRRKEADFSNSVLKPKESLPASVFANTLCLQDNDTLRSDKFEVARRSVENGITEFWLATKSRLKAMAESSANKQNVEDTMKYLQKEYSALYADALNLAQIDNANDWRQRELFKLASIVQTRLESLQNPSDCQAAPKMLCDLNKGCGFGCQLHHVVYCFITAYAFNRTLVVKADSWSYSSKGWTSVFEPVAGRCSEAHVGDVVSYLSPNLVSSNRNSIKLPLVDSMSDKPVQLPLAVPKVWQTKLAKLHGLPSAWWIGQFVARLWRLQPEVERELTKQLKTYQEGGPMVGVHVRRTDKIGSEAAFHSIAEYMPHVDQWFDTQDAKRERHGQGAPLKRRVYLATDDAKVIQEARQHYGHYDVLASADNAASAAMTSRYTDSSLHAIIADVHFLAHCQHLVCTFSSQVCRLAFELAQTLPRDDPSQMHTFTSLDDVYYFGGQQEHQQVAIMEHKAESANELDLRPGDLLGLAGNHWDGWSKGFSHRLGRHGLYPSHKVREKDRFADFPSWPND